MSRVVLDWVWFDCSIEHGQQRFVLLAIARHCTGDDGTGAHPSTARLAAMVRKDEKTVRRAIVELERNSELLVIRPTVGGRGRYNSYVVVMGRDVEECRLLTTGPPSPRTGPPRPRATEPTYRATEPGVHEATDASSPTGHRAPDQVIHSLVHSHREGGHPAPFFGRERGAEGGQKGGRRGRGHAQIVRRSGSGSTEKDCAARVFPAREALDPRLHELRDLVTAAGVVVEWGFSPSQTDAIAVQLDRCGADALAGEALALVARHRDPPRSAHAWINAWELLPPPAHLRDLHRAPWCGRCERDSFRFVVDADGLPSRKCPSCHPASTAPAPF